MVFGWCGVTGILVFCFLLLLSILLALVSICYVGGMSWLFVFVLVYTCDSLISIKGVLIVGKKLQLIRITTFVYSRIIKKNL